MPLFLAGFERVPGLSALVAALVKPDRLRSREALAVSSQEGAMPREDDEPQPATPNGLPVLLQRSEPLPLALPRSRSWCTQQRRRGV